MALGVCVIVDGSSARAEGGGVDPAPPFRARRRRVSQRLYCSRIKALKLVSSKNGQRDHAYSRCLKVNTRDLIWTTQPYDGRDRYT
jgi:hypothetical protein